MKIKMNIRQKILVYILGVAVLLFAVIFFFISSSARRIAYDQSIKLTDSYARQYALNIEGLLNQDFAVMRTMSHAFMEYKQLPFEKWQELIYPMYNRVMQTTTHVDAIWDSWELSNLDPKWDKPFGRHFYIVYKRNGVISSKSEIRSLAGDPPTYGYMKSVAKEIIVEPYVSALQEGQMMTTLSSPFLENGKFIGLVGADLILTRFQEIVGEIKPYPNSYAFLISHGGNFIAHPDTSIFKKNIKDKLPELDNTFNFLNNIQKGKTFNFITNNSKGERMYYSVAPINIGNTGTPWAVGIVVPINDIMADANRNYNLSILIGFIGLLLLIVIIFIVTNSITIPVKKITELLQEVAKGKIDKSMGIKLNTGDEIAIMADALTESIKGINAKTEFAREIGSGNLEARVELLSNEDLLGKSLIEMRDNLKHARVEEENRKIEEEKKKWVNEGLAKFGDILRQNNDNLGLLCDEITKNLVWYLNASIGGIFILNENKETNDKTFDMVSAFAYDRKRFLNKSYHFAEGLIGACAAERDIVMLTEIPQEYIEITSGLGDSNPNFLFLIPLITEEQVMGVIEIASLRKFQEHEIGFVRELAKSIATTLHSVKVNALTSELFMKSKEQAEMMAAQEEEMRQNMEELQATQEEAARKTFELEGLVSALNASSFVMEYDINGFVTSINEGYLKLIGAKRDDVIGMHHTDGIVMSDTDKGDYTKFWADLMKGIIKKRKTKLAIKGEEFILLETYTPIFDQHGDVYKVLKIATDITNIL
ncbi:MAG TPA: cache domain-containing protein [Tenuifilaceae bacterium]|nr:cache domain-containing protein [Tenuifilaceae bacterium]